MKQTTSTQRSHFKSIKQGKDNQNQKEQVLQIVRIIFSKIKLLRKLFCVKILILPFVCKLKIKIKCPLLLIARMMSKLRILLSCLIKIWKIRGKILCSSLNVWILLITWPLKYKEHGVSIKPDVLSTTC